MYFLLFLSNKFALIDRILTTGRFSKRCSSDESKHHFDIIPEIASYASCGTCEPWISLLYPLALEDFRTSHLPMIDHFSDSFSKLDVNFLPLFRTHN